MFERFNKAFVKTEQNGKPDKSIELQEESWTKSVPELALFLKEYSGFTFNSGLYRVHKLGDIQKWNEIVGKCFPDLCKDVFCFSYDWLGRHFALKMNAQVESERTVIMLEPGTGEMLEMPVNFVDFHNYEIIDYQEESLACSFFQKYLETSQAAPKYNECIGYKIPLFLGGGDDVDNLEVIDLEVYWDICGQLLNKIRDLPPGTPVGEISLS